MAEIKSESVADFSPESVADFPRNTQLGDAAPRGNAASDGINVQTISK
jgi:hypothetical protein